MGGPEEGGRVGKARLRELSPACRHILSIADTKRILGIRYSDWLLGAPSLETGIAASSMAQDEWGHARLLYSMLKEFGVDPMEMEHRRRGSAYCSMPALDEEFPNWAWVVAGVAVADAAASAALESIGDGSLELARRRVPKILAEERFHADFGAGWILALTESEEGAAELKKAVLHMAPSTLAWLIPQDGDYRVVADNGTAWPEQQLLDRVEELWSAFSEPLGIRFEEIRADRDGWESLRRRGPGAPNPDTIARARGDRNRALFVE